MEKRYVIGIDLGTTGTKAVVFDLKGNEIGVANLSTPTYFPRPGRVEQNAEEVIERLFESTKLAISNAKIDPNEILGISFTHMCTTFVPVDKDGNFLYKIILWNDTRGAEMFDDMRAVWKENDITEQEDYEFTGYPLGPLCSVAKVLWLKKNHADVYNNTYKFIGMQALMTSAFTGEQIYYDDLPGIIYTKLANLETFKLDPKRAEMYGVDLDKYPERKDAGDFVGTIPQKISEKTGLPVGTPIYVGAGDQRCAAVGAGVAKDGMLSAILGTAGVVHAYSSKPIRHPQGKISIMGHSGTGHWQAEGSSSSGASSFRWLRDTVCQVERSYADLSDRDIYDVMTELASQSPAGSNGVLYTAWLAGADCPRFDVNARGTFTGLSFSHNKSDLIRSVMEGACFEMKSMIDVAEEAIGKPLNTVRIIGGGAKSKFWSQMQADIYNKKVETITSDEATALAAAMFVAMGANVYKDIHEAIDNMVHVKGSYEPNPDNIKIYEEMYGLYHLLYNDLSERFFPAIKKLQDDYVISK